MPYSFYGDSTSGYVMPTPHTCNLSIVSAATGFHHITIPNTFQYGLQNSIIDAMTNYNSYTWKYEKNINILPGHTLIVTNSTPISNRNWFVMMVICVSQNLLENPKIHNYSLVPTPDTCVNVTTIKRAYHVTLKIITPSVQLCSSSRIKREWYDTLLGGTGTAMGVLNGVDMEILKNKLSTAASHLKTAFHVTAQWAPTVVDSQITQLALDKAMLTYLGNLTYAVYNFTLGSSSWSMCAVRYLWMSQQHLALETTITTSKFSKLSQLLPSSPTDWIHHDPTKSVCHEYVNNSVSYFSCQVSFMWYKIQLNEVQLACKFTVLPFPHFDGLIRNLTWWIPSLIGDYVIPNSNHTFTLNHCSLTTHGYVCRHSSPVYEPCLLHTDLNICNWHVYPSDYSMMIEIAPQSVCIVTNAPVGIPIIDYHLPFSGCLSNLTILHWGSTVYYFSPIPDIYLQTHSIPSPLPFDSYQLPLHVYQNLLSDNTAAIAAYRKHDKQLYDTHIKTIATKTKLISLGSNLQDDLQHHWYDVFTGWSPTGSAIMHSIFYPLVGVTIILLLLVIFNLYLSCTFRKRVQHLITESQHAQLRLLHARL
ncbi:hypothetical protein XELAEV_18037358mg [Xenopus laevis]|uniref:Uncharacterized protein n=1 Tax=Xenopus laevis TaxID=8355 RepID=A0A974CC68_XENLA|nr:hypothetical protein XELAEV_18037358mg [Xenopus laevis]